MTKYWETKSGDDIPYKELKDSHLLNILKWIKRKAITGHTVVYGGGGWDIESMWYEVDELYGKDVLEHYDYKGLLKEAKKRKLKLL